MKTKEILKYLFALTGLVLSLSSCEDVIEVELDSIPPRMVIEGVIMDVNQPCQIKLSKTSDYFKPGETPVVTNALVTVTDENGDITEFEETAPGTFTSSGFTAIENTSYTLLVVAGEESYTAACTLPEKVSIDSLSFEIPPPVMEFEENAYLVTCYFHDPGEYLNYYRLQAYKKGHEALGNQHKLVFNDDFTNGNVIYMPWDMDAFFPMDTVVVELQTLDRSTYDYFRTLYPILGGGMGASNPANPKSNISNDALGYFGAFTVSRDTIVIQTL